ncbi:MAG: FAD:protein FMN transferase [Pseudomonadota bacterium]
MKKPALFALAFFMAAVLVACGPPRDEPMRLAGQTMGTTWSLVLSQSAGQDQARLQSAIERELVAVNDLASTWQADSELSRFNADDSGDWIAVSPALHGLFNQARDINSASEGAFDATVGPLVNLWGFGPDKTPERVPDDDEIAAAKARSGPDVWQLKATPPSARKSDPGVYVDLSALAKGYGVDRIGALLKKRGASNFLVEIGGELLASGVSPRGDAWKIGIEKPQASDRGVHVAVSLKDGGLATSGDYRNFFERDGVRYSHTIDPRDGKPITHRLASVSVYAADSATADAWATALMVLGEEKGFEVAEQRELAAYFLYKDDSGFSARVTEAFKPLLEEGQS